jgi:hypothetical protein
VTVVRLLWIVRERTVPHRGTQPHDYFISYMHLHTWRDRGLLR